MLFPPMTSHSPQSKLHTGGGGHQVHDPIPHAVLRGLWRSVLQVRQPHLLERRPTGYKRPLLLLVHACLTVLQYLYFSSFLSELHFLLPQGNGSSPGFIQTLHTDH